MKSGINSPSLLTNTTTQPILPKQSNLSSLFFSGKQVKGSTKSAFSQLPKNPMYKIDSCKTVRDVVNQWVNGIPSKGISPLMHWVKDLISKNSTVYSQRKAIGTLFQCYKRKNKENEFWDKYSKESISKLRTNAKKDPQFVKNYK